MLNHKVRRHIGSYTLFLFTYFHIQEKLIEIAVLYLACHKKYEVWCISIGFWKYIPLYNIFEVEKSFWLIRFFRHIFGYQCICMFEAYWQMKRWMVWSFSWELMLVSTKLLIDFDKLWLVNPKFLFTWVSLLL